MNRSILIALLATFWVSVSSAEQWRFHLQDGSVVLGEMVSLINGVYVVNSPSLGRLHLRESNIREMVRLQAPRTTQRAPRPAPGTQTKSAFEALFDSMPYGLKMKLMSDSVAVEQLYRLRQHPGLPRILANRQIIQYIKRGDINALRTDPRVQPLLNDPAIQRLLARLAG